MTQFMFGIVPQTAIRPGRQTIFFGNNMLNVTGGEYTAQKQPNNNMVLSEDNSESPTLKRFPGTYQEFTDYFGDRN